MSAWKGFSDRAPNDQFVLVLKSSEMGTAGAPARVLPVPRASRVAPPPEFLLHLSVWLAPRVTVTLPETDKVSMIMPLVTLLTSSAEKRPFAPSAETNGMVGTV